MKIDYTNTGGQTAQVKVTIEPEDYIGSFDSELKEYQKKVNLKGFRKGKTPKSMIRKMYGVGILSEIVTKKLQSGLDEYLKEENIEIIGRPIPAENQEPIRFETGNKKEYSYTFDVGLKPDFELDVLSESFHYYDTEIPDETIDKEIETLRLQAGNQVQVKSDFENGDLIYFNGWELEADEIKKNGLEASFDVEVSMMREDFRAEVLSREIGDQLDVNIYEVEEDLSDEQVRKYLLQLDDDEMDREVNAEFRLKIVDARRQEPADVDEKFLEQYFGEDVKTEEEARELIRKQIKAGFDQQADNLTFSEVRTKLLDEVEMEMPDEFLIRLLKTNQEQDSTDTQPSDEVAKQYESNLKRIFRWDLIEDKLVKKYDIVVEDQEIVHEISGQIQRYLPAQQLTNEVYNQVLQSMLQSEEQVMQASRRVQQAKVFNALKADLNLDKEIISPEAFKEKLKELNEANRGEPDETSIPQSTGDVETEEE